ncbi:glycosyltransferase family 2 protein [Sedimentitalea sp. XS_ASV28]|uniref:glycosyltransferase family 2 protein n=1 Tax=Sedimentitalea sp. XS_ASV28 TaxID=3241296 RepID=UPI003511C604
MTGAVLQTIILNYKTADMTLQSAEAALAGMEGVAGGITIVDNDSRDGSFETLDAAVRARGWDRDGRVTVIQSGRNGGFGAGNNVGIRAGLPGGVRPDYVYILNSDAFPEAGAIRLLMAHLDSHPETGLVGSYIHGPEGDWHCTIFRFPSIWSEIESGIRFGPVTRLLKRHVVPMDLPDGPRAVDWTAGASLMMRREMLDRIGLFDETFFLYFEETDLCRRARLAGWPTVYLPESRVTHIGSVSTGMKTWKRMPAYWFDSRWHYFSKNHGAGYAALATASFVTCRLLFRLRCKIERKPHGDAEKFLRDMVAHAVGLGPARTPAQTTPAPDPAE